MNIETDLDKTRAVKALFTRIAGRYVLMNSLMTLGQDSAWRREAVRRLHIPAGGLVLDIGAGTGDIALEIKRSHADCRVVASDLTLEMVRTGRKRRGGEQIAWVIADAQRLPFRDDSFHGVTSGFLLRNVPSVDAALSEQRRVTQPAGRMTALDTTRPTFNVFYPIVWIQLRIVIPLLGRLIAGDADAYRYLPRSTEKFLLAEELAHRIGAAGFRHVGFARRMFGTIAVHWARKLNG